MYHVFECLCSDGLLYVAGSEASPMAASDGVEKDQSAQEADVAERDEVQATHVAKTEKNRRRLLCVTQ